MSFSRYDEDGARTSHHPHRCIGARHATHCATGDDEMTFWVKAFSLNIFYSWLNMKKDWPEQKILFVFEYCISHNIWLVLHGHWDSELSFVRRNWVKVCTSFMMGGNRGLWHAWGWLSRNTEPPFIAWFKLLASQTRWLASIILDNAVVSSNGN